MENDMIATYLTSIMEGIGVLDNTEVLDVERLKEIDDMIWTYIDEAGIGE